MTQNRARWNFIIHPAKPPLETLEVNYWKSLLSKLIKVGAELEFNLPTAKGLCKRDNISCGCRYLFTEDCWMSCANYKLCSSNNKNPSVCVNRTEGCTEEKCDKCPKFMFNCISLACSHFVSKCIDCDSFELDCKQCKFLYDQEKNPDAIRGFLNNAFTPNNCYGTINESGVHSVKTDGSLLGGKGAEVITIGRRVDFWEFYRMFKNIIDISTSKGAYVNERCSVHMHLLASYYENAVESQNSSSVPSNINELEKAMPEIILINFHQLMRKYQNAITWMAMGLDKETALTRWEKFRVSILEVSPLLDNMRDVVDKIYRTANNSKYGFVDYRFCAFDNNNNVRKLHAEIRALDGIISPSVLASFACLYQALLIKAVEISRWGILEMDSEWYGKAKEMKSYILNGTGAWDSSRFGDTRSVLRNRDYYMEEAIDMIQQLKHILLHTGPSYDILEEIAKEPVALKRLRGMSWEEIEKSIEPRLPIKESEVAMFIEEAIDLRIIKRCKDTKDWVRLISAMVKKEGVSTADVEEIFGEVNSLIEEKYNNGIAIWSNSLGTVVSIN